MFPFQTVFVLSLIFSAGVCRQDFGCIFQDEDQPSFKLKSFLWVNQSWGPDAVWGTPVDPIVLQSNELDLFRQYIEFVQGNIFKKDIFDEALYFARLFSVIRIHKANLNEEDKKKTSIDMLLDIYEEPMEHRKDNLGLIMKFFKDLRSGEVINPVWEKNSAMVKKIKNWSEVLKSKALYIAAVSTPDLGLKQTFFAQKRSEQVLPDKYIDSVVGVIKIKHEDDIGYIIVDMKRAFTPLPFVWTKISGSEEAVAKSLGEVFVFGLIGEDNTFIKIRKEDDPCHHFDVNAVYIEYPLCSFHHTENFQSYHKFISVTAPVFYKLSDDLNSRKASVVTHTMTHQSCSEKTFTVYFDKFLYENGVEQPRTFSFNRYIDLSKREQTTIFSLLAEIMNIDHDELVEMFTLLQNVNKAIDTIVDFVRNIDINNLTDVSD